MAIERLGPDVIVWTAICLAAPVAVNDAPQPSQWDTQGASAVLAPQAARPVAGDAPSG